MTPKQFVDQQLDLPEHARVIPDRIYMAGTRLGIIQVLRVGINPFNAGDAFMASVLYEPASYFRQGGSANHKYYPNGVFNV